MNHNYKLTDFRMMTEEADTDIHERVVSIYLKNVSTLPVIIVKRLEAMINNMIVEHEQENNVTIPTDNAELGIYMNLDTWEHTLSLDVCIGYSLDKECITGKEVIAADDEEYAVIKEYFFTELRQFVSEQLRRMEECA